MIERFFERHTRGIEYVDMLHGGVVALQEDKRVMHRVIGELLRFRGPLGLAGRVLLNYDHAHQQKTLVRAQEIGAKSVERMQGLYESITGQRDRHRDYLERVKRGFENARAYTGVSAEDREFIEECGRGLEKVLHGNDQEISQGLAVVLPSFEHVEVVARQEGWFHQAREDYQQYCKEGVLHYMVHLILGRELLLVTDRVGRRVEHQNYLIQNLLDMMHIRKEVMLTSQQLDELARALKGSEQVFGEAVSVLHGLSARVADPQKMLQASTKRGAFRYEPYGEKG